MKGNVKPLWPLSEEGGFCENAQACFPVCISCESENSRFFDTWWSDRFGMLTSRSTQITSSFHRRSKEFGSEYKKRRWWQTSKTKSSKYLMRRPSPVKHHHEIQLNPGQQEKLSSQDGSNSLQQVQLQTIQVEKFLKWWWGQSSRANIRSDFWKRVNKCLGTTHTKKSIFQTWHGTEIASVWLQSKIYSWGQSALWVHSHCTDTFPQHATASSPGIENRSAYSLTLHSTEQRCSGEYMIHKYPNMLVQIDRYQDIYRVQTPYHCVELHDALWSMIHDLNMKVQEKIQRECTLHTARPTSGDQASWAESKEAIREKPDRGNPWNVDDGEGDDVSDDDDAVSLRPRR